MRVQPFPGAYFNYHGKLYEFLGGSMKIPQDQRLLKKTFFLQITEIKIGRRNSIYISLSDSTYFIDNVRIDEAKKLKFVTYFSLYDTIQIFKLDHDYSRVDNTRINLCLRYHPYIT